jgi:hypothetical protein
LDDTLDTCFCNDGFGDIETFDTGLTICYKACETTSSTYVNRTNDCDCDPGYETLYLSDDESEFYCEALCDTYSTTLNYETNECECNDGFTSLETNTDSNT